MRIHLIAIGGSAMHNIAITLHINHHTVSGSDDEIYNPAFDRLAAHGLLPVEIGWHPELITEDLDIVIIGMHARSDNPELLRAKELGLTVLSYPEFVFKIARKKQRIVVAGSHGKTTTTSMILHVLKFCQMDFDYLVGAQLEGFEDMVRFSEAPLMVIEGDEYLSSPVDRRPKFLHYHPHITILTGIAWDHINVFPTFENYLEQFEMLLQSLEKDSLLIYYKHDPHIQGLIKSGTTNARMQDYEALPAIIENGNSYLLLTDGRKLRLQVFGRHNLENLAAALQACTAAGVAEEDFFEAIQSFGGAAKRLQVLASTRSAIAFQDFAHAPSKVRATIAAVKEQFPDRKLYACLELHTFSSLNHHFLKEYAGTMSAADHAVVYFSRHTLEMKKLPDLTVDMITGAFDHPALQVFTASDEMAEYLRAQQWADCNLLMMSSGTFGGLNLKEEILRIFGQRAGPDEL